MNGGVEPRSKHQHAPQLERFKKSKQDVNAWRSSGSGSPRRAAAATAIQQLAGGHSSPDTETADFIIEPRKRKSTAHRDYEEEIHAENEDAPPEQQPHGIHFGLLEVHPCPVPSHQPQVNYQGKGMTGKATIERRKDPRSQCEVQSDYRFHTQFHRDFYNNVILTKNPIVAKSQWVDWQYTREQQKPSLDKAVSICRRIGAYKIMEFQHDWNTEVIAQFYATMFFEETRLHWMLEGDWYSVDYEVFAAHLGFTQEDLQREKIHIEQALPPDQMGHLYPAGFGGSAGKVEGLHPTYRYLERMFRRTIDCKGGDKGNITHYSKNLMVRMAPGARLFSIFDFIWCEIKSVGERTMKGCGFAPYIMHMIEMVTGHTFEYDKTHTALRILAKLPEPIEDPAATPAAGASPPRAPSPPRTGDRHSPIKKMFSMLFGICRDVSDVRNRQRKADRTLKLIHRRLELEPPRSPLSDEEPLETFEQQEARYDDYFYEFVESQRQRREAKRQTQQQQTEEQQRHGGEQTHTQQPLDIHPLSASVPPHVQPRLSAAKELWQGFFGSGGRFDYNYGGLGSSSGYHDPRQSNSYDDDD